MRTPYRSIRLAAAAAVAMAVPVIGCAPQEYRPEPLEPAKIAADFAGRRSDDGALREFMARQGYVPSQWPPSRWTLEPLTLMAIYFHPDMEVARANLDIQRAAEITAGQRPNPAVGPGFEHHSNIHNGPVTTPWSIGIGFDIPIETGGKRDARIAKAEELSEEARLAIGAAAWKIRGQLRAQYVDVYAAESDADLSKQLLDLQNRQVDILERFRKGGEASPTEVSLARLRLQEARLQANAAQGAIETARAGLAQALGLPFAQTEHMPLGFRSFESGPLPALSDQAIEASALENRLDLQGGLARYAAAEASVREEIAKQYPDFHLSPGFLWDQGDLVKSLAATVLLPVLNQNEGPIAEAEARRKLEAARYKSLQAGALAELSAARVRYEAAVSKWKTATDLVATQENVLASAKRSLEFGETNRLAVVQAETELVTARRNELQARVAALHAWGAVEDAVQRPLEHVEFKPDAAAPGKAGGT